MSKILQSTSEFIRDNYVDVKLDKAKIYRIDDCDMVISRRHDEITSENSILLKQLGGRGLTKLVENYVDSVEGDVVLMTVEDYLRELKSIEMSEEEEISLASLKRSFVRVSGTVVVGSVILIDKYPNDCAIVCDTFKNGKYLGTNEFKMTELLQFSNETTACNVLR